jgi:hypothetical protein
MGLLRLILGWNWKIRKLRKKWDRLREKALKKDDPLRHTLLEKLDSAENNLRILEEQRLSRVDRARLSKTLEIDLEGIKAMLKGKPEEFGNVPNKIGKV